MRAIVILAIALVSTLANAQENLRARLEAGECDHCDLIEVDVSVILVAGHFASVRCTMSTGPAPT